MRAKSNGICQDCKTRVVMNKWGQTLCFNCQSRNVVQRKCALCEQPISVGDDCSWDRRGGKWEAHTRCWLNSSPEARERVIRAQEERDRGEEKQVRQDSEDFTKKHYTPTTPVDIDTPEVTPLDDDDVIIEEEEDKFVPLTVPKIPVKCASFYDSTYLLIAARIHFYIYGPAGCGKSHIVEQAAHHYGLSFSSISLNVMTQPSALLGFMGLSLNDGGKYVSTDFRRIWEFGGVFLVDEMDNASGNLLTTLNSGLANGFIMFPDGMVVKHPDCVVVATGNTTGRGKTAQYIGRQTLDAATLDRFVYLSHKYDESLELALAMGTVTEKTTTGKVEYIPCVDSEKRTKWAKIIQAMRKNQEKHNLQVVVSYRPTVTGCKLLNHFDHASLLEMLVLKGVDADTKHKLMEGVYV